MQELRWALLGLGLLFLVGLALWEWRRSRRQYVPHSWVESAATVDSMERSRRIEPSVDGTDLPDHGPDQLLDVPTIHPAESLRVGVLAESAVDVPAAARFEVLVEPESVPVAPATPVAIQWPPANAAHVVSLRVVSPKGVPFSGRALRIALEAAGLQHGPQKIYHQVTAEGGVVASVANLMRPGDFEPARMDTQEFRGLNVFSVLPGPLPPVRMLEDLVGLARSIAQRMSAVVQDEHGAELDAVRVLQLRQNLPDSGP